MLICLRGSGSVKSSPMAINDIDVQKDLTKIKRDINPLLRNVVKWSDAL